MLKTAMAGLLSPPCAQAPSDAAQAGQSVPNIARSAIEEKLGMDVATLEVTIEASLSDVINGVPIMQAIGQGLFDGAAFRIDGG